MKMQKKLFVLVSVLMLVLAGCGNNDETTNESNDLRKVSFVLDWMPNTNHTGIYVAKEKGYFEEAGLDVEILLPGEVSSGQLVATGKADFGINYQESLMMARNEGLPLVSITAIMQHNTAGYASTAEKNITEPADLAGKVFGANLSPLGEATMKMMMEGSGVGIDDIKVTNIGDSDFFVALQRDIDFSLVFQGWTGIEAEIRDIDLNMMYLKDYAEGLDYYTPIIATSEKLMEEDPALVKDFIHAAVKGYEFTIENPAEAAEILIDQVPDLNEELVRKSQEWLSPRYQDDAERFGIQEKVRYEKVRDFMIDNDLIEADFDIDKAFTNEFLPE